MHVLKIFELVIANEEKAKRVRDEKRLEDLRKAAEYEEKNR